VRERSCEGEREREIEKERKKERERVCVCVYERGPERGIETEADKPTKLYEDLKHDTFFLDGQTMYYHVVHIRCCAEQHRRGWGEANACVLHIISLS
jgi:hypothetical protein